MPTASSDRYASLGLWFAYLGFGIRTFAIIQQLGIYKVRSKPIGSMHTGKMHTTVLFDEKNQYYILTLREQADNVRMVVSPLWRGPRNIHGLVLDEKSCRQG